MINGTVNDAAKILAIREHRDEARYRDMRAELKRKLCQKENCFSDGKKRKVIREVAKAGNKKAKVTKDSDEEFQTKIGIRKMEALRKIVSGKKRQKTTPWQEGGRSINGMTGVGDGEKNDQQILGRKPCDDQGCRHFGLMELGTLERKDVQFYIAPGRYLHGKECSDCKKEPIKCGRVYFCNEGLKAFTCADAKQEEWFKEMECHFIICEACRSQRLDTKSRRPRRRKIAKKLVDDEW